MKRLEWVLACTLIGTLFFIRPAAVLAGNDELKTAQILELHPTQDGIGERAVDERLAKLQRLSSHDFKRVVNARPVPVVIGPNNVKYMVDRHHLVRALAEGGWKTVPITVVADWCDLHQLDFWQKMAEHNYTYLTGANGRVINPFDLPKTVFEMHDDAYRSLSSFVKDAGGFEKPDQFFIEFYWAEFFRGFISMQEIDRDWDRALKKAMRLARSPLAVGLPGYIETKSAPLPKKIGLRCEAVFGPGKK